MELRHLQLNLIKVLKVPEFYEALRFEESYLWGEYLDHKKRRNSWVKLEREEPANLQEIADLWIIPFPASSARKVSGFDMWTKFTDLEAYQAITEQLESLYRTRNLEDSWGSEVERIYRILIATQRLKSNVLKDKLVFCHFAHKLCHVLLRDGSSERGASTSELVHSLGRFYTLRSGVLHKIVQYINRLRDLRSPVERSLDLSTLDDPRPLAMRRKGQGLYNEFLNERTHQYHVVAADFLSRCGDLDERKMGISTHHRWEYSAHSTYAYMYDDSEDVVTDEFVNSLFWMADRPDLEPQLAHEISHFYVRSIYDDLGESALKDAKGGFAGLIRSLSKVFFYYRQPYYQEDIFPLRDLHLIRELSVDLIAAVACPHAYLWAVFTELVGLDLFESLETPAKSCDLLALFQIENASSALSYSTSINRSDHLWSVRLLSLCDWVEEIDTESKSNPLAKSMVEGVRNTTIAVLDYVEARSPLNLAGGRGKKFILDLHEELSSVIKKHSVVNDARKIVETRHRTNAAALSHESVLLDNVLPIEIREAVVEQILSTKTDRVRSKKPDKPEKKLSDFVPINNRGTESLPDVLSKNALFLTRPDLSWTAFQMRSIEACQLALLDEEWSLVDQITQDFNPGQEWSALVLDISIWLNSYPGPKLARAAHVVGKELSIYASDLREDLERDLRHWLNGLPTGNLSAKSLVQITADPLIDKQRRTSLNTLFSCLEKRREQELSPRLLSLRSWLSCSALGKAESNVKVIKNEILDAFNYTSTGSEARTFLDNGVFIRINFSGARPYSGGSAEKSNLGTGFHLGSDWLNGSQESENGATEMQEREVRAGSVRDNKPRNWPLVYCPTLGRFDGIGLAPSPFEHFMPIPPPLNGTLLPISIRTERSFPIRLFPAGECGVDVEEPDFSQLCATLAIKLGARDDRLAACLRISRAVSGNLTSGDPFERMSRLVQIQDRLIMTDGDTDLVIFLFGEPQERLNHAFEISRILRDDFMVESCETLQASRCMSVFDPSHQDAKKYKLFAQIRLHRDTQSMGFVGFAENYLRNLRILKDNNGSTNAAWHSTPGRLDFEISIDGEIMSQCISHGFEFLDDEERSHTQILNLILGFHERAVREGVEATPKEDYLKFASVVDETITTIAQKL